MSKKPKAQSRFSAKAKDQLLCVGVAALILAVIGAGAALSTYCGVSWTIFFNALQFLVFTVGLFGVWVFDGRSFWQEKRFWGLTALALLAHTLGLAVLLKHFGNIKPIWFAIITLAEIVLLIMCKSWFVAHLRARQATPN